METKTVGIGAVVLGISKNLFRLEHRLLSIWAPSKHKSWNLIQ